MRRMLAQQRASWPWLRHQTTSPSFVEELMGVSCAELCLLHWQEPTSPVLGEGRGLLLRAWAAGMAWAWAASSGERLVALQPWDGAEERAHDLTGPPPPAPSPFDLGGLTERQAEVLGYATSGLSWQELGRMEGRAGKTLSNMFRKAVGHLLEANPELVERFGLVPCNRDHRHSWWCGVCRGFGWLYADGTPLTGGKC